MLERIPILVSNEFRSWLWLRVPWLFLRVLRLSFCPREKRGFVLRCWDIEIQFV
jgi:hypothetical protein